MPEFEPGVSKTAKAPVSNPKAKAFDYRGVLYMGVNMVAMKESTFHLEPNEVKEVSFPIVMPTEEGEYPVYLDVFSDDVLLVHYQAVEGVTIVRSVTPFIYSNVMCSLGGYVPGSAIYKTIHFSCTISNLGVLALGATPGPTPPPPESYTCKYCGSEFDTLAELNDHVKAEHPLHWWEPYKTAVSLYLYAPDYPDPIYHSLLETIYVDLAQGESIEYVYESYITAGIGVRCFYVVDEAGGRSVDCCFST